MLDLRQVQAFHAVVQLGTFSAAAKALCLTQPAISCRIRDLERHLGVKLFETSTRRAVLTPRGRDFSLLATQLVDVVDRIVLREADHEKLYGQVRVGTTETVAISWLGSFVKRAREQYRDVLLDIDVCVTEEVWEKFRKGLLDLIIVPGPINEKGLQVREIGRVEYSWIAGEGFDIPRRVYQPQEIADYPIISVTAGAQLFHLTERWFNDHGASPSWFARCNSLEVVLALTQAGLGLSLLPVSFTSAIFSATNIQRIDVEPGFPPLVFYTVYRKHISPNLVKCIADLAHETSTFS